MGGSYFLDDHNFPELLTNLRPYRRSVMCGLCFRAGYSTTRDMDLRWILGWIIDGVEKLSWGFPGGPVVTDPPAKAGGTWVQCLVREDPSCRRTTKPMCRKYLARVLPVLKPASARARARSRGATAMTIGPCTPARTRSHSPQAEEVGGVGGHKEDPERPREEGFPQQRRKRRAVLSSEA